MPINIREFNSICESLEIPDETISELLTFIEKHKDTKTALQQPSNLDELIATEDDWKKKVALIAMKISRTYDE